MMNGGEDDFEEQQDLGDSWSQSKAEANSEEDEMEENPSI